MGCLSFNEAKQGEIYRFEALYKGEVKEFFAIRGEHENGFGDEFFDSYENAAEMREIYAARDAANAATKRRFEEESAIRAQKEAEYRDVDGFTDGMSKMREGRVLKILNKLVRYKGKTCTRKELIRSLVSAGWNLHYSDGVRTLENDEYCQYEDSLTKTGMDYAEYLIAKSEDANIDEDCDDEYDPEIERLFAGK